MHSQCQNTSLFPFANQSRTKHQPSKSRYPSNSFTRGSKHAQSPYYFKVPFKSLKETDRFLRHVFEDGSGDARQKAYTTNLDERISKFSLSSPSLSNIDSDNFKRSRKAKRGQRKNNGSKLAESIKARRTNNMDDDADKVDPNLDNLQSLISAEEEFRNIFQRR